jgi:hypothetical protein
LPCQGWAVEVMILFKQLANDHTPTGHDAPQAMTRHRPWRARGDFSDGDHALEVKRCTRTGRPRDCGAACYA